ncbi:MAG TPA: pyrroloquinoline quinone biosynthesis peptide chaperone PqqD [Pseudorhizobium sp.]|nr:pyrroloquinoline quinone biosynthesis peptide chaperone PqqD [Pseudorhizobium sp.]
MMPPRERRMLTADCRPRLKPYVRLQHDPVRQAWALLSPEKVFWPDETSLDILRLCNGELAVHQILGTLASQYEARPEEIASDLESFLQEWSDRSLVTL